MHKGIVIKFLVKGYLIRDLETKKKIYAQNKGNLKFKNVNKKNFFLKKNEVKIGDIVFYIFKHNIFLIESIMPRKNFLNRPNIANIDQVFLTFSLIKPNIQFKLLDKFLIILKKLNLEIILVLTKIDLLKENELFIIKKKISYYKKFYPIYFINNFNKSYLNLLYSYFKNKLTILVGPTGVGKSTLISNLISKNIKTQTISVSSNRGKHTTKNSRLYFFKEGYIADTPGFSKFFLFDMKAEEIKNFYEEFLLFEKKCFFGKSCLHIKEKKCGIKEAYEQELISFSRYKNYLSIFNEIKNKKKIF